MNIQERDTTSLLIVRGLSHEYRNTHLLSGFRPPVQALENIRLVVRRRSTLAVVGESGAGKSTLARCLALLERPTAGEILLNGQNLLALSKRQLFRVRPSIQLVFQDPTSSLNPRLTAAEIIAEPLVVQRQGTRAQQYQRARELMNQVGLPPKWSGKRPLEFSGGQRQRLAIARTLALKPTLIIFDEALSSLDLDSQELILQLLAALQTEHSLTYIHISHDLNLICQIADEIAVMHRGRIVEQKPTNTLIESQDDPYARELFATRLSTDSILTARFAEMLP
jgi:peptide/nickel transport system ATP-binding protein